MDTKGQLFELIRELGLATIIASELAKNIDYLESLGNDISKLPKLDYLVDAAIDLWCLIDKANANVMCNETNN